MPRLRLSDSLKGEIGCWDTSTAVGDSMVLSVDESRPYGLILTGAEAGLEYDVLIGDIELAQITGGDAHDAGGRQRYLDGSIYWPNANYFESGRGRTTLALRQRDADTAPWKLLISASIFVLPTKLGEERYEAMALSLHTLCSGLLLDLIGKSKRSYEHKIDKQGISFATKEVELRRVEDLWKRIAPLIQALAASPVNVPRRTHINGLYWGDRPMSPATIAGLSQRGYSLRSSQRPIRCRFTRVVESSNTPEHAYLLGFLTLLHSRIGQCVRAIDQHIHSIQRDRMFRDVTLGPGPTLYELVDIPRLQRLGAARKESLSVASMISNVMNLPLFSSIKPKMDSLGRHSFSQNNLYQSLFWIMQEFLKKAAFWPGDRADGEDAKLKLTSRLYEHWVFMRLIDEFRLAGVKLASWEDYLRESVRSHFSLEFDRGLCFEGPIGGGRMLRITFEPWIASREQADNLGLSVYRDGDVAAWCPDIMIELRADSGTRYAVVIDCKYTRKLGAHSWDTTKYLRIRSVASRAQVVRQLWLVHPSEIREIAPEDDAVTFTNEGVDKPADEQILGVMGVFPDAEGHDENDVLSRFASGTLEYFRRLPVTVFA